MSHENASQAIQRQLSFWQSSSPCRIIQSNGVEADSSSTRSRCTPDHQRVRFRVCPYPAVVEDEKQSRFDGFPTNKTNHLEAEQIVKYLCTCAYTHGVLITVPAKWLAVILRCCHWIAIFYCDRRMLQAKGRIAETNSPNGWRHQWKFSRQGHWPAENFNTPRRREQ